MAPPPNMAGTPSKKVKRGSASKEGPDLSKPQQIITFVVGKDKAEFKVHTSFLCHYSPYFRAALTGPFVEAGTGRVELPEETSASFGLFVHWLYTQEIRVNPCLDKTLTITEKIAMDTPDFKEVMDLWILADYLDVPVLQNIVVDLLHAKIHRLNIFPQSRLSQCYERTNKSSPLRRYLVDWFCIYKCPSAWFEEPPNPFTREVLADIATRLVELRIPGKDKKALVMADYYVKVDGEAAAK